MRWLLRNLRPEFSCKKDSLGDGGAGCTLKGFVKSGSHDAPFILSRSKLGSAKMVANNLIAMGGAPCNVRDVSPYNLPTMCGIHCV